MNSYERIHKRKQKKRERARAFGYKWKSQPTINRVENSNIKRTQSGNVLYVLFRIDVLLARSHLRSEAEAEANWFAFANFKLIVICAIISWPIFHTIVI